MKNFFPYFLECSKKEKDKKRKKDLENLAFNNSLIILRNDKYSLLTERGEFIIPEKFSQTSWNELKEKLWGGFKDYNNMEEEIKDNFSSWSNIKKRDKIRKIDNLIIKNINEDRKYIKTALAIFFLLKVIKDCDIEFKEFEIKLLKQKKKVIEE